MSSAQNWMGLKYKGILVKICPVTMGLKTRMLRESFDQLCAHFKEQNRREVTEDYTKLNYNCSQCKGKPKELSFINQNLLRQHVPSQR